MFRVATLRQTPCLSAARSYAGSAPAHPELHSRKPRQDFGLNPRQPIPVDLSSSAPFSSDLQAVSKDSLADNLLRNTESGQNALLKLEDRIKFISEQNRLRRLEKEARDEKQLLAFPPIKPVHAKVAINRPASSFKPAGPSQRRFAPRGQGNTSDMKTWKPNGDPSNAGRASGSGTRGRREREREPAVVSDDQTDNYLRSLTLEQAHAELANPEDFIDDVVDRPNTTSPTVSHDLSSIFRAQPAPIHLVLSKVPAGQVASLELANRILRRFGGDYTASVPPPSKAVYTTPVNQLPVYIQLQMAMAKSKDMKLTSQQYMLKTVSKNIGVATSQPAIV